MSPWNSDSEKFIFPVESEFFVVFDKNCFPIQSVSLQNVVNSRFFQSQVFFEDFSKFSFNYSIVPL